MQSRTDFSKVSGLWWPSNPGTRFVSRYSKNHILGRLFPWCQLPNSNFLHCVYGFQKWQVTRKPWTPGLYSMMYFEWITLWLNWKLVRAQMNIGLLIFAGSTTIRVLRSGTVPSLCLPKSTASSTTDSTLPTVSCIVNVNFEAYFCRSC